MADDQTTAAETPKPTGAQDDPVFLTNMSVRSLGCKPRLVKDKPILLCRIWGLASDVKTGEDRRSGNPWTALSGEFAGVNMQEGTDEFGKSFRSGKLFLPGGIQEVVEKAVAEMKRDAAGTGSVRFAMELLSATSPNASGYTYQAKKLIQPAQEDPITEIFKALPESPVKLPTSKQLAAAKK